MTASNITFPFFAKATTDAGAPISGAKAYFYETGTTTPVSMFTDSLLSVAATVPLVSDANGIFPQAYWAGQTLRIDLFDASDVRLSGFPVDDIQGQSIEPTAAADISYTPTTNIVATDVQASLTFLADELRPVSRGGTGANSASGARTNLGIAAASEGAAGLVEKATDAEVTTGTDTTRYMSVKQVIDKIAAEIATEIAAIVLPTAGETTQGIIEIATQAEVTAGSDTARAVVPSTLSTYVAAQIAAIPGASFDLEAGIQGLSDATGGQASGLTDTDELVVELVSDSNNVAKLTLAQVYAAMVGDAGGFDLNEDPIVYSDTDGVGAGTYTFSGASTVKYFILWGYAPSGGITTKPSSVIDSGSYFAGPASGGDTITGSGTAEFSFVALKLAV